MVLSKLTKEQTPSVMCVLPVSGVKQTYDPALARLFSSSLEHVKDSIKSSELIEQIPSEADLTQNRSFSEKTTEKSGNNDERKPESSFIAPFNGAAKLATRKRKRSDGDDDLEGRYLSRLAREEANKNQEHPRAAHTKRQKQDKITVSTDVDVQPEVENESTSDMCIATGQRNEDSIGDTAQHESIVTSREDLDLEKSSRTVFLANVSTSAIKSKRAKKELLDHLVSFASSLPLQHAKPVIESLRFRSTAFVDTGVPKKVSFAKKELMDTTTKSTNAYAVYTTQSMAKEAAKRLNGTMLLGRHIRVDLVAHPAKIDHRRCVFVGNLGFVDDETKVQAAKDEETKKRPRNAKDATDVEEGLWRQFKKAGTVESVRVVRDKKTRVGKGIAYVQFEDANSVEKALLYNDKKFPPMLPRLLRVSRAKTPRKVAGQKMKLSGQNSDRFKAYRPKIPSRVQSLTGRASKLLGRAGAAQLRYAGNKSSTNNVQGIAKTPGSLVFEGYRASGNQGKGALKTTGRAKKHGKPSNRSRSFKAEGKKRGKA